MDLLTGQFPLKLAGTGFAYWLRADDG